MNRSSLCYGEKKVKKQNPRWPHFTTSSCQTEAVSFLLLDCIHLFREVCVENKVASLDYPVDSAMIAYDTAWKDAKRSDYENNAEDV
jgi:hypothetical protein